MQGLHRHPPREQRVLTDPDRRHAAAGEEVEQSVAASEKATRHRWLHRAHATETTCGAKHHPARLSTGHRAGIAVGAKRRRSRHQATPDHPLGLVPSQTPSRDHRARDRAPRSSRHLSRIRRAHGRARAPHTPHELSEPGAGTTHRERTLELLATLLLSIATVGIAWSGYQAARWSGIEARRATTPRPTRRGHWRTAPRPPRDRTASKT